MGTENKTFRCYLDIITKLENNENNDNFCLCLYRRVVKSFRPELNNNRSEQNLGITGANDKT